MKGKISNAWFLKKIVFFCFPFCISIRIFWILNLTFFSSKKYSLKKEAKKFPRNAKLLNRENIFAFFAFVIFIWLCWKLYFVIFYSDVCNIFRYTKNYFPKIWIFNDYSIVFIDSMLFMRLFILFYLFISINLDTATMAIIYLAQTKFTSTLRLAVEVKIVYNSDIV